MLTLTRNISEKSCMWEYKNKNKNNSRKIIRKSAVVSNWSLVKDNSHLWMLSELLVLLVVNSLWRFALNPEMSFLLSHVYWINTQSALSPPEIGREGSSSFKLLCSNASYASPIPLLSNSNSCSRRDHSTVRLQFASRSHDFFGCG